MSAAALASGGAWRMRQPTHGNPQLHGGGEASGLPGGPLSSGGVRAARVDAVGGRTGPSLDGPAHSAGARGNNACGGVVASVQGRWVPATGGAAIVRQHCTQSNRRARRTRRQSLACGRSWRVHRYNPGSEEWHDDW